MDADDGNEGLFCHSSFLKSLQKNGALAFRFPKLMSLASWSCGYVAVSTGPGGFHDLSYRQYIWKLLCNLMRVPLAAVLGVRLRSQGLVFHSWSAISFWFWRPWCCPDGRKGLSRGYLWCCWGAGKKSSIGKNIVKTSILFFSAAGGVTRLGGILSSL